MKLPIKEKDHLNTYYYINAVSVERVDGALRCKLTKRALDDLLRKVRA